MKIYHIIALILFPFLAFPQDNDSLRILNDKNGIEKLSVLSTHPFGIFFSRQQANFKKRPNTRTKLQISLESGNVWGTPIKTYIPNDEETRELVKNYIWHQAQYYFEEENLDAKTYELQIDGVIKGLRTNLSFKISHNQELNIGTRLYFLTNGKYPFSIFTNDEFIEYFHENIGGGQDPFDRKVFGLGKANISYSDRNGNDMVLDAGNFIVGGVETSYYYYPKDLQNKIKNLNFNFGGHLGINLSQYNSSIDLGLSVNSLKTFNISRKSNLHLGLGIGGITKNTINFKDDNMDFGNNKIIAFLESALEYNFIVKKNIIHSFGADFYVQTPLNKIAEKDYIIPIRHPDAHNAWGHGVTNLYKFNDYWTFMYSFTKKNTITLYIQQDFTVNNNPDIQTGIGYSLKL